MISKNVLITAFSLLWIAGCNEPAAVMEKPPKSHADGTEISTHVGPDTLILPGAQGFVNATAAADRFAIESAKLAARNSDSAWVKHFAAKALRSHSASTANLRTVVAGIAPKLILEETSLTAEQRQQIDVLKDKRGAEFDRDYFATQIVALETTLKALEAYAAVGENARLSEFAKEMLPGVAARLKDARMLV